MRAAEELKATEGDSVTIACDETWQRIGFSSKNGVATCLSISSKGPSKVIDTETLTNYSDAYSKMKSRKKGHELKEWGKKHEKDCKKTTLALLNIQKIRGAVWSEIF
ncbi:hypothetical protein ElyMa_000548400 [Elysia marginata]|uniref:Uncharacterized protein n=1 Tax=Elysia marginata TaxID=1093978 RepID=A0AAV4G2C7_9GAST|nr:hypothetical protein ElyMa_000548400 [Elysia marginata]